MWPENTSMDMYVYFSTNPEGDVDFSGEPGSNDGFPSFSWKGLTYGNWDIDEVKDLELSIPENVQHNASLWADIFLTNGRASPDPKDKTYDVSSVVHVRKLLTRYYPRKKIRKEVSLIGGPKNATAEQEELDEEEKAMSKEELEIERKSTPIISYWHPNVTLTIISDRSAISFNSPPEAKKHVQLEPSGQKSPDGQSFYHYPVVFANDFWNLREHMTPINSTTPVLPIRISLSSISFWKFNLYSSMGASFEAQASAAGGSGGEIDEIKRMLVETNPILLVTTVLVTILHMLFEFLAFSSDIGHWRKKDKDLVGVSLRTILTNCFVQLIILLYLQDSSTETSWVILFSQASGLMIEAWKVFKIVNVAIVPSDAGAWFPYKLDISDKKELSEDEKKTQEYDALAFRLVNIGASPLLVGYTIYSLLYETHRGWYSFVVSTLAQAIYMFGFVQLIPQLIINYKLKSVAHMPMKAMVYKTLSTVVDDFFSFVIKMPWLHRLACFRDDVVFLVLIYQRWIYRVDKSRANEYGQVLVDQTDSEDVKAIDAAGETKKDK
ncbi:cleft lip and palate associated transmembrane protein [Mrakia frigida]|uniref:CLPTM1 family protein n=1 Tax=Mrakia frigida TaxID=29902 RepID=UPI003FCBFED3